MVDKDPPDDEVLSLDEVKKEEELVTLALSAAEWELIIALAELGGQAAEKDLRRATGMEGRAAREVLASLSERGIVRTGARAEPSPAASTAPEAEVSQYLEYLRDLNHYQVLQLDPDCDQAEVRSSYYRLMRHYHPDRFMSETSPSTREQLKEIFRILTRAYETLSDTQSRREYDLIIPEFSGALDKEDELAFESLWSGDAGPGPLPDANPELAKSFYESALEEFQNQRYEAAELNFKLAAALDPGSDDFQAGLLKARRIVGKRKARDMAVKAWHQEAGKRFQQAIRSLGRAVELDPEEPSYRFDLARLIEARGRDLDSARMHILLALDRSPGKVDYLMLFGKIQERLGEYEDARRTCKKVLSLDPDNREAKVRLKRLEKGG